MTTNTLSRHRYTTIGLCFLVAILEGYDLQAMGVAAPKMIPLLGLTPQEAGWCFSAAVMGLAIGAIAGGWLSDRFGRKKVLLFSVLTFGAFTLATAHAYDFTSLFLARLLTGLGFGGAMPNLIALTSEASPKKSMTTSVAVMFGGLPLGGALAAMFALHIVPESGWRMLFYVGGGLPFLLAPLLAFTLPETKTSVSPHTTTSPKPTDSAVHILFGRGQLPITLCLWIAFAITLLLLYLLMNWMPSLVIAKGLPAATASTAAFWFNVASIPGAFVVGYLTDRYNARWPLVAIYLLMAGAMLLLATVNTTLGIVLAACLAGITVIGAQFTLYGLAPHFYPSPVRGTGVGAAVAAGRIGSILGPLVAGQMLSFGASADKVVLMTIPLIVLAALAIVGLTVVGRKSLLLDGAEDAV